MNAPGIFITGTGTEVGKTVVTAGLLRLCRSAGIDAVPMKPVQTGCEEGAEGLSFPDLQFSVAAAALNLPAGELALASPYRFLPACSPHLAARLAGRRIEISRLKTCAEKLLREHDFLLVEGAGGILVPLDDSQTMLDLMKSLDYPVLLVAPSGLGAINHTLLAIEILRQSGLEILGVVFNTIAPIPEEDEFIHRDNPATIASFGKVKVMGTLGYLPGLASGENNPWGLFAADLPGLAGIVKAIKNDQ